MRKGSRRTLYCSVECRARSRREIILKHMRKRRKYGSEPLGTQSVFNNVNVVSVNGQSRIKGAIILEIVQRTKRGVNS